MASISIGSGMWLHVIPSEKFTTRTLCVLVHCPLARETVTMNALVPKVLRSGSRAYPSVSAISLAAERLYGSVFDTQVVKKGEQQILQFYFECVDDDAVADVLDEGLVFLRETILNPLTECGGFSARHTRAEAEHLRKHIESRINDKREYVKLKCLETMCENEPFGLYGDGYIEDLPMITPEGLFRHYKKTLATAPISFIALGRFDVDALAKRLSDLFAIYRDEVVDVPAAAVKPGRTDRAPVHLSLGASQGNLCVGLRGEIDTRSEMFVRLQMANEILGGGPNAKLFTHVREKESLCYFINSTAYRFKGLVLIQSGVSPDQFENVLHMVNEQIEALKNGDITDEELDNAKRSLTKRWRSLQDYPAGSIDFYASQLLLQDEETLDGLVRRVGAVQKDQIAETTAKLTVDTVVTAQ